MKTSEKNAQIPIGSDALLINNKWNESALLPGEVYDQEIAAGEVTLNGSPWWRWDCSSTAGKVMGYPSIIYGKSPHSGMETNTMLPMSMNGILDSSGEVDRDGSVVICQGHLDLDYSLKVVNPKGVYNVMIEMWITSGPEARKDQITHEIMIVVGGDRWTELRHKIGSAIVPMPVRTSIIGGIDWTAHVYYHPRAGHKCIIFDYFGNPRLTGILPIHEVLDWCRRWAGLREGYLACVEIGTEIKTGSGMVVVQRYEMRWS